MLHDTSIDDCRPMSCWAHFQDMHDTEHESKLMYRNFVYNKQDIDIPLYFEKREESECMNIFIYM